MEFVELLDKIDDSAPRGCQTCRHMATHRACGHPGKPDYCLTSKGMEEETYRNWVPGNWLRDLQKAEINGERNIVIGGQGEAEVDTKQTPQQASKHLHYVAEQCGYYVGRLCESDGVIKLQITTSEGVFSILWRLESGVAKLWKILPLEGTSEWSWPHFTEDAEPGIQARAAKLEDTPIDHAHGCKCEDCADVRQEYLHEAGAETDYSNHHLLAEDHL